MNIYALSSGPGASGIAVIRISGDNVREIITLLTNSDPPSPRVATVKKFNKISNSELIDEGLLLWFPGPESYTGEDMAEIQVHGSVAVIRSLLDQLSKVGNCRLAEPGEFTKLAFQNGKINLLKAESISDLISAETEIQRQQAIKVMSGRSSEKFNSIREKLLKILSNVEAKIDFPEEDLPVDVIKNIKSDSEKIRKEVEKILDDQKVGERIREGFKIAILGPTNAGKSSLLNYLSKREVAIVSEIAGTTRDVIEAHLNLDGYPVVISDTAGIRESQDEIEKKGIKLALKRAEDADLNIIVIEPKNVNFTGFLNDLLNEKSIIVINKIDLGYKNINQQIEKFNPIFLSIKNETNLEELINRIKDRLKNKFVSSNEILITRERHRQSLDACVQNLKNFEDKNSQEDFDKAAEDLRLATRHLGMIVGKVDVEEILGSIFSDFCIGK
jgi:tRNA modification GTPase